jgi:protease-4
MKHLILISSLLFLQNCIIPIIPGSSKAEWEEKYIEGRGKFKIVIIPVEGVISDQASKDSIFGTVQDSMVASIREQLRRAEHDSDVKGVILKINSPGGGVTASDVLYHEIMEFKKRKKVPVHSLFYDVAASGGYYIAMASDHISAHPTTVTGSIGVIMRSFNAKEGLDKIGVKEQSYASGANKNMGSPFSDVTPEAKQIYQSVIDDMYEKFLFVVQKNRSKINPTDLRKLADGRIYSSKQALDKGLVDSVGYTQDAFDILQKEIGEKCQIIIYQRGKGRVENVYQVTENPRSTVDSFLERFPLLQTEIQFLYLWGV